MSLETCVLTVAHDPDFQALAARLVLSRHYLRGPKPTTVVVFDDIPARERFCEEFRASSLCRPIVALDLAAMLGAAAYSTVRHV